MLTTTLKPRTCAHCETRFTPVRPMQKVCSPICARRKVEAEKKAEKAQTKARKQAIETVPKLIREAQVEFNAFVRARDQGLPCISCGSPWVEAANSRDAGHYRSRGSAGHLRFDEDNCHSQCKSCNRFGAGMVIQYRAGLVARIGLARVEALEAANETVKWDRDTLRQIKTIYRAKARQLLKERG